ncbi:hypothetical protein PI93_019410 [Pandoraea fibrosis]|uniref:Uncharacterized protein n=1 Tax=Pandoraea fibrosis TaxID=1891094 RepID=A0ABX6HUI7_9BURK|nr:hypothetical protein [Pandoraea fibrosis]QHE91862.1 hypothetical protein PJ20_008590 [Pandoraea fibrosis]QHF14581.1 hypothetical protein PI93_019410 [Pandoraea fibrosis]
MTHDSGDNNQYAFPHSTTGCEDSNVKQLDQEMDVSRAMLEAIAHAAARGADPEATLKSVDELRGKLLNELGGIRERLVKELVKELKKGKKLPENYLHASSKQTPPKVYKDYHKFSKEFAGELFGLLNKVMGGGAGNGIPKGEMCQKLFGMVVDDVVAPATAKVVGVQPDKAAAYIDPNLYIRYQSACANLGAETLNSPLRVLVNNIAPAFELFTQPSDEPQLNAEGDAAPPWGAGPVGWDGVPGGSGGSGVPGGPAGVPRRGGPEGGAGPEGARPHAEGVGEDGVDGTPRSAGQRAPADSPAGGAGTNGAPVIININYDYSQHCTDNSQHTTTNFNSAETTETTATAQRGAAPDSAGVGTPAEGRHTPETASEGASTLTRERGGAMSHGKPDSVRADATEGAPAAASVRRGFTLSQYKESPKLPVNYTNEDKQKFLAQQRQSTSSEKLAAHDASAVQEPLTPRRTASLNGLGRAGTAVRDDGTRASLGRRSLRVGEGELATRMPIRARDRTTTERAPDEVDFGGFAPAKTRVTKGALEQALQNAWATYDAQKGNADSASAAKEPPTSPRISTNTAPPISASVAAESAVPSVAVEGGSGSAVSARGEDVVETPMPKGTESRIGDGNGGEGKADGAASNARTVVKQQTLLNSTANNSGTTPSIVNRGAESSGEVAGGARSTVSSRGVDVVETPMAKGAESRIGDGNGGERKADGAASNAQTVAKQQTSLNSAANNNAGTTTSIVNRGAEPSGEAAGGAGSTASTRGVDVVETPMRKGTESRIGDGNEGKADDAASNARTVVKQQTSLNTTVNNNVDTVTSTASRRAEQSQTGAVASGRGHPLLLWSLGEPGTETEEYKGVVRDAMRESATKGGYQSSRDATSTDVTKTSVQLGVTKAAQHVNAVGASSLEGEDEVDRPMSSVSQVRGRESHDLLKTTSTVSREREVRLEGQAGNSTRPPHGIRERREHTGFASAQTLISKETAQSRRVSESASSVRVNGAEGDTPKRGLAIRENLRLSSQSTTWSRGSATGATKVSEGTKTGLSRGDDLARQIRMMSKSPNAAELKELKVKDDEWQYAGKRYNVDPSSTVMTTRPGSHWDAFSSNIRPGDMKPSATNEVSETERPQDKGTTRT